MIVEIDMTVQNPAVSFATLSVGQTFLVSDGAGGFILFEKAFVNGDGGFAINLQDGVVSQWGSTPVLPIPYKAVPV